MVGGSGLCGRVAAEYIRGGVLVSRLHSAEAGACHGEEGVNREWFDVRVQPHLAALEPAAHHPFGAFGGVCCAAKAQHLDPDRDAWADEPDFSCSSGAQRRRNEYLGWDGLENQTIRILSAKKDSSIFLSFDDGKISDFPFFISVFWKRSRAT